MIGFFASHKTAANLLMILGIVVGVMSLPALSRETFPELPVDEIRVSVAYPGATPQDVEDAICRRIEDAIDGIENVHEVRSEALESLARVTVEIVQGADVQIVFDDVQTEIDAIDDFPDRAEPAVVRQIGRTISVASIAVTGDMSVRDLKAHCEQIKDRLLRDPIIEVVDVAGFSDHQIRIEVPAVHLMQYGISATDIAAKIREQSLDLPAGTIKTIDSDVIVRFTEERRRPFEFEDLVVIGSDSGAELRLGEIATIRDVFELDEEKFVFNGQRAGLLQIKKTRAQDALSVVDALKNFIATESETLPEGATLTLTQDTSSIARDRLEMLIRNGWQGLLLVFFTMWLFFSFRLSIWVVLGLPVSFLGAFFLMTLVGYSINMLTMVALLLALGLLMDDSIVLAENVATHLARGKSSLRAAVDGVNEVKAGVLSSFMTTVVVFGPISFLSGDIGAVLKVLPVVLIMVLAVSLIEAFLILPAHLAHALHGHDPMAKSAFRTRFDNGIEWIRENLIGRAVDACVRWRYLTVGTAIMTFLIAISMLAGGVLKFRAFPSLDGDVVVARVLMPQGTPLTRTEAVVERITRAFDRVNEEFRPLQPNGTSLRLAESVQFNVNTDAHESGPHVATVTIDLLAAEERDAAIDDVLARWREEVGIVPDVVSLKFAEPSFGPAGLPIEIRIAGDDLAECKDVSLGILEWLAQYRGVLDLFDDLRPGKPEARIRMIEGAASLGVSSQVVASQLRAAILGDTVSEIQIGAEGYEIDLRVAKEDRDSVADLEHFHVTLPDGTQVPVNAVAEIEAARGFARIARINSQRSVTIQGDVDPEIVNVSELLAAFQADEMPRIAAAHPNIKVTLEGEVANGAETQGSMVRAFLIGMIGIFVLLSFQFRGYFEPLIVMTAIPLSLIGVVFGHLGMGLALTLPSMMGFVSLAGIVVNDSILLVEFVKTRRREGATAHDAACLASRARFRAVLLTSMTTIVGMLPLLTEASMQAQVLIPLAASIVFGLASSTVLVLLVVPSAYSILADLGFEEKLEPHNND